jgi:hypothetical protein
MENNKTKYLLGLMLALVWGLVGYRIYDKYFDKKADRPNVVSAIIEEKEKVRQDSFRLFLDYKDPFQYAEIQTEERPVFQASFDNSYRYPSVPVEKPKPEVKPVTPVPIIFPDITYKGNIKSKFGRVVALVNIDGNISNLAVNETSKDVQISNIYDDSIRILYKNMYKTILKVR